MPWSTLPLWKHDFQPGSTSGNGRQGAAQGNHTSPSVGWLRLDKKIRRLRLRHDPVEVPVHPVAIRAQREMVSSRTGKADHIPSKCPFVLHFGRRVNGRHESHGLWFEDLRPIQAPFGQHCARARSAVQVKSPACPATPPMRREVGSCTTLRKAPSTSVVGAVRGCQEEGGRKQVRLHARGEERFLGNRSRDFRRPAEPELPGQ